MQPKRPARLHLAAASHRGATMLLSGLIVPLSACAHAACMRTSTPRVAWQWSCSTPLDNTATRHRVDMRPKTRGLQLMQDRLIRLWNPHRGVPIKTYTGGAPGCPGAVQLFAVRMHLAALCPVLPPVFVLRITADRKKYDLKASSKAAGHGYDVRDVTVSADNSKFASAGGDRQLFLWDVATGQTIRKFAGHDGVINSVIIVSWYFTMLPSCCLQAT
jgi:WD40 repeat protein